MPVSFIDLKRYEPGFLETWDKTISQLSRNTQFIGGAPATDFEEALKRENNVQFALGCANGTDAIQVALRACGVGPGDKVLIPDLTFWATFEAVVNVGADPVSVDISPDDLQMDFALFQEAVEKHRPKAAILVHLYGWGSKDLGAYRSFCRDRQVKLIEDGAQCYGVKYRGKPIYEDALISTISFYPAKVLGAAGDAGAILTNDSNLADACRSLCNHGRDGHYSHGLVGWNSRLDTFQAAFLNLSLPHLGARLDSRRRASAFYRSELGKKGIACVAPPADYVENGYLNVCLYNPDARAPVEARLKEKGIGFGITYPMPVSQQKGARGYLKGTVGGAAAAKICASVLNLPLFPYITEGELAEVVSVVSGS